MQLGYYDKSWPGTTYLLDRRPEESKVAYARRFFSQIRGLGNVCLVVTRGNRRRIIARRSW